MPDTSKSFTYNIPPFVSQIFIEYYSASYMMCRAQYNVKMEEPLFKSKRKIFAFFCSLTLSTNHHTFHLLFNTAFLEHRDTSRTRTDNGAQCSAMRLGPWAHICLTLTLPVPMLKTPPGCRVAMVTG